MMAQARSLGFMMIVAGQDMAAMQSISPQIAETVAANARLTAAGAMEDAHRTWEFLRKKFSNQKVATSTGRTALNGLFGTRWEDRADVSFVVEDRVKIGDLQRLREGEFYFLMESVLVRARAFYTGEPWFDRIASNKFVPVRGPRDRAPGLDQSYTDSIIESFGAIGRTLVGGELSERSGTYPFGPDDSLECAVNFAIDRLSGSERDDTVSSVVQDSCLLGILSGSVETAYQDE